MRYKLHKANTNKQVLYSFVTDINTLGAMLNRHDKEKLTMKNEFKITYHTLASWTIKLFRDTRKTK